jgi:serine/threonine protein kinase
MLNQLLNNRYQIQQQLSQKAGRRTYLALDLETQQTVIIKLLLLTQDFEWEQLKLFEREAAVLQNLDHLSIPKYLDYFEVSQDDYQGFALVQTYIEAESLENYRTKGRCFTEEEIKQLAKALLEILIYLQTQYPPIIHRDIKPSNILLKNRSGNSIGEVYLVDFGAVQNIAAREGATLTIVGTYGYMPPEQFGGRTVIASDIYSLGATLIYLITGSHPADLPTEEGRLQFEAISPLNKGLSQWLKRMIEPSLEKRFASAEDALNALEKAELVELPLDITKPLKTKIILNKTSDHLEFYLPPSGFHPSIIAIGLFATAWNTFLVFWTGFAFLIPFPFKIVFLVFSLPFWGAGLTMIASILHPLFCHTYFEINQSEITQTFQMFGFRWSYPKPCHRRELYRLELQARGYRKDSDGDRVEIPARLSILAGKNTYEFKLSEPELEWMGEELSNWLEMPLTRPHN